MNEQKEIKPKINFNLAILLVCDHYQILNGISFEEYQKREPGFAKTYLKAWQYMLNNLEKDLTPEFIIAIHDIALSHSPGINNKGYKTESNCISCHIDLGGNISVDGLVEFIEWWLVREKNPIHSIEITNTLKSEDDKRSKNLQAYRFISEHSASTSLLNNKNLTFKKENFSIDQFAKPVREKSETLDLNNQEQMDALRKTISNDLSGESLRFKCNIYSWINKFLTNMVITSPIWKSSAKRK